METYLIYILKCRDKTFYTDITSNLEERMAQHRSGIFPKCYTFRRRPVILVYCTSFGNFDLAMKRLFQIKNWSQAKKEALIRNELELLPNLAKKRFV